MAVMIDRYTDAPEVYDGFGTETIAVVGTSRLAMASGNPVRLVRIREEHDGWQTARYDSGGYAWTSARCPLATWVALEDWTIDRAALEAADPETARTLEQ